MKIEQIYTGCLAQGAYYISCKGEAAIIDPLREVGPYIERAQANGDKIKYIFETHFHADFVSGHIDLSAETGAPIIYGPSAETGFDATIAKDGQEFKLGDCTIRVLHTPGHTMESTCYLMLDENGIQKGVFTGDTLFIGDVGRPDLAQKVGALTMEDLAGFLYESLHSKIMPLSDDVVVYPAHGAGSACGKNMSNETTDTLGHQKATNYALLADTKEKFVAEVTDGILPPPAYFPMNVAMNKGGYQSLDSVKKKGLRELNPLEFEVAAESPGVVILDTRHEQTFKDGFIPGSTFIGLDGTFAPWVGSMISDVETPILFVCDEGKEEEVVVRLSRVGFDNTLGFLKGGIDAWRAAGKQLDSIESISAEEFAERFKSEDSEVFDVRRIGEFHSAHVQNAHFTSLQFLNDHMAEYHRDKTNYIHCAGGYRSMIAASILKARGFERVVDVAGGFAAIKQTDVPLVENIVV